MHVRVSDAAKSDLRAIHDFIVQRNPRAANNLLDKILNAISILETFPLLGKPRRVSGTRELVVARTKFFVVYTLADAYHVDIERILHAARDYPWRP